MKNICWEKAILVLKFHYIMTIIQNTSKLILITMLVYTKYYSTIGLA